MGSRPIFCLWGVMDLRSLLESTLPGLGYELVDMELSNRGKQVRVFIDKPDGITVEDCTTVSNHLTRLFAVEDVDYDRLEISSPGLDRPLRKEADFIRFSGHEAKIKLKAPLDGRKNYEGTLGEVKDGRLALLVEGRVVEFALVDVDKARLVPRF